ncbi:FMN-binding negative transcriptional regulator [Panacibacter sp. DH6]|uniref:FMN-binding negative transcriptional regulator n=1 Tax=Panacibacter microcysteis TaxID=2793269 RepID=A0A931E1D8_9BACT|nr:FMN-binding negative transcriptional regulator [Panacibacter microcysteis]MBG9375690.1 FMN-binding negative transcriptional regulator [Panacibacter microcysteis]
MAGGLKNISAYLRFMYNVPHFKTSAHADVVAFMHAHPFITLCGINEHSQPVATHIPVLIEERNDKLFLLAHVMRKQEHTKAFEANPNVLAIFSGAHSYVSASWYENKQVASTWNYQAVHARGILQFLDDAGLYNVLKKLTANFEQHADSPSLVEKMDEQYMQHNMKAIAAFEIELTDVQHVFKLSQNRDEKSYNNIIETLGTKDADAQSIAATMQSRKSTIFPS